MQIRLTFAPELEVATAGSSSLTGVMSSSSGTATVRRPARRSCSAWRSEAGRPERRPRAPQAALPAAAAKALSQWQAPLSFEQGLGAGPLELKKIVQQTETLHI